VPEYEVHNFDENALPRSYEAVYLEEGMLLKVLIGQRNRASGGNNRKPAYRWHALVVAWTPGQNDNDYTQLCHLNASEMTVRDVRGDGTASEEDWLTAARYDAEKLMGRARVFVRVLAEAAGKKRKARA
jgi:hypothetical protein